MAGASTALGATVTADQHQRIKSEIHDHLQENGVFSELKHIVASVLGREGSALTAVQQVLAEQTGAACAVIAAAPSTAAGSGSSLHVQLLGGRAFAQALADAGEPFAGANAGADARLGTVCVCLQFGAQRFRSRDVPFCAEPELRDTFLVELPPPDVATETAAAAAATAPDGAARERLRGLVRVGEPMHLLVLRTAGGKERVLSSLLVEWRTVALHGACVLCLELPGLGVQSKLPVGSLELKLELLPLLQGDMRLTEAEAMLALKHERDAQVDAERRFFSYARAWWVQFLEGGPEHQSRPVKLFAMSELGTQRPVTTFVAPLRADRLIDSPMAAAHFVSLVRHERQAAAGATVSDVWRTVHATLATRAADTEEHALLLASLLLGFGLEAYVCIGTDGRGPHAWVMTVGDGASGGPTFWESLTGQRYDASGAHPYLTLACAFSHEALFANLQPSTALASCSLALSDAACWMPMQPSLLRSLTPLPLAYLTPPSIADHAALERAAEAKLRSLVGAHRAALGLSTVLPPIYGASGAVWDDGLSYMLSPAIASYENERLTGHVAGTSLFQAAVRRAVPTGHTFKGIPQHFTSADAEPIFAHWLLTDAALDILQCCAPGAKLALRLRVFPYPDGLASVWAMLAVSYRPDSP